MSVQRPTKSVQPLYTFTEREFGHKLTNAFKCGDSDFPDLNSSMWNEVDKI